MAHWDWLKLKTFKVKLWFKICISVRSLRCGTQGISRNVSFPFLSCFLVPQSHSGLSYPEQIHSESTNWLRLINSWQVLSGALSRAGAGSKIANAQIYQNCHWLEFFSGSSNAEVKKGTSMAAWGTARICCTVDIWPLGTRLLPCPQTNFPNSTY